jgi:predicted membrane channel-forming protein YqfA (hemolysin III family)
MSPATPEKKAKHGIVQIFSFSLLSFFLFSFSVHFIEQKKQMTKNSNKKS